MVTKRAPFSVAALLRIVHLTCFPLSSFAQAPIVKFNWAFGGNAVSTNLQECQNMSVVVTSFQNDSVSFGVPPYYFMAMEVGGIPTVNLAGSRRTALSWQVNHRAGTKLMLTVIDANGTSGGIPSQLYDVIPGQSQSCFPPPPKSNFTVSTNVTGSLNTCQPWGIRIKGGTKPYSISLAALTSTVITNVTLSPADDVFTYIDRADPGTQLMVVAYDANGQFANGSSIVNTVGSSNYSCTGLISSSGNSTVIDQEMAKADQDERKRHQVTIIAAVVAAVGALLIGAAIGFFMWRRRRYQDAIEIDTRPRKYERDAVLSALLPSDGAPTSGYYDSPNKPGYLNHSLAHLSPTPFLLDTPPQHEVHSSLSYESSPSPFSLQSTELPHLSAETAAAAGSGPRSRKAREVRANRSAEEPNQISSSQSSSQLFSPSSSSALRQSIPDTSNVDVIIQHRDAGEGGVVQELPPPYADRKRRS